MLKEETRNKKGFTLIEIIVVIVILAVLMAVAVPSVMSYMKEGQKAKYEAVARAALINTQIAVAEDIADDGKANEDGYVILWVDGINNPSGKKAIDKYGSRRSYGSNVQNLFVGEIKLSGSKTSGNNDLVSATYYIKLMGITGYRKVEVTVNGKMNVADSNVSEIPVNNKYTFTDK